MKKTLVVERRSHFGKSKSQKMNPVYNRQNARWSKCGRYQPTKTPKTKTPARKHQPTKAPATESTSSQKHRQNMSTQTNPNIPGSLIGSLCGLFVPANPFFYGFPNFGNFRHGRVRYHGTELTHQCTERNKKQKTQITLQQQKTKKNYDQLSAPL